MASSMSSSDRQRSHWPLWRQARTVEKKAAALA